MSRRFNLIVLLGVAVHFAFAQTVVPPVRAGFAASVWVGNVTTTGATVALRLTTSGERVRLIVSPNATPTLAVFSDIGTTAAASGNALKLSVQGLVPDTDYFYSIEVNGVVRTEANSRGRFHTFPVGKASFKIAFGGDSHWTDGGMSTFDEILATKPLLFIHMGDLHYNDTNTPNPDDYRSNFDNVLNQPNEAALYRNVPLAYMWDDHDFCGNNSDGTFLGRDTARAVYKERVPHYPLATNAGGTIAQSFTVGRVRVIMTDLRSAADPEFKLDNASKTHLGAAQKAWFKQELLDAHNAGFPLILWVCTNPWIGPLTPGQDSDNWTGFQTERTEIANFIKVNHISNVVLLSADMHALAYDDGTHSDYATGGGAPLIVLHAAALTQGGTIKGGPYTVGPIQGSFQYGLLEVFDNGGPSVACRFQGVKAAQGVLMSYSFSTANVPPNTVQALVNISTLARVTSSTDTIISGFVIAGSAPRTVLMRAVGPTLALFGLTDALATPQLFVFRGGTVIGSNTGWASNADTASQLTAAFDRTGAFRLVDSSSRDSALLLTLDPGAYTIQVKSATNAIGAALLEVYDDP